MTKQEAFDYSRKTGSKITHRHFSDQEFIIVSGGMVTTTEGYLGNLQEFMSYRTDESWDTDWELFPETVTGGLVVIDDAQYPKEFTTSIKTPRYTTTRRYSHHTSHNINKAFGNITKFKKK